MKFNPFCRSVKHPVLLWDRGRVCGRQLLREYVPTDNNAKGGPLTGTGVIRRQIYHHVHSLPWYSAYTLVDLLGRNDCRAFHILFHQILCCFSHHLILISLHYSPFPLWLSTSPPPTPLSIPQLYCMGVGMTESKPIIHDNYQDLSGRELLLSDPWFVSQTEN